MDNFIQQYQQQKERLLHAFDELVNQKFIPYQDGKLSFNEKDIAAYKVSLAENKFYISICGQIKAGKSTFLNFLLFNDRNVLPTAATPQTAKLTKISYSETEYAEITFYSKCEWEELRNMRIQDEESDEFINWFDTYLQEYVNNSAQKGVYSTEVILEKKLTKRLSGLEGLDAYIAGEGVYTPFVAGVEIFVNHRLLKDVVIVDTPGINDANQLRSKVTTDFINRSSAIVYLFYANKPFGIADLQFIDEYLFAITSSKIVFGASRCDLARDLQSVIAYIEKELTTHPELAGRHLLINRRVRPFSTMAAIIKYKLDNAIELTADEQYLKKKISPILVEKSGYWNELMREIGEHIMNDKGRDVLNAAADKIRLIATGRINSVLSCINICEQTLKDVLLDRDALSAKMITVQKITEEVHKLASVFLGMKSQLYAEIENDTKEKKAKIAQAANSDFENWLSTVNVKKALKISAHELKYILQEHIEQHFNKEAADTYIDQLNQYHANIKDKITSQTRELFPENKWKLSYKPAIPIYRHIEQSMQAFSKVAHKFSAAKETNFWIIDKEATRAGLQAVAAITIDEVLNDFTNAVISVIQQELDGFSEDLREDIMSRLNVYLAKLSGLQQTFSARSNNQEQIIDQLNGLRAEAAQLQQCWNNIRLQAEIV
jgi:GTPase Era involved in 16S rRNA processing